MTKKVRYLRYKTESDRLFNQERQPGKPTVVKYKPQAWKMVDKPKFKVRPLINIKPPTLTRLIIKRIKAGSSKKKFDGRTHVSEKVFTKPTKHGVVQELKHLLVKGLSINAPNRSIVTGDKHGAVKYYPVGFTQRVEMRQISETEMETVIKILDKKKHIVDMSSFSSEVTKVPQATPLTLKEKLQKKLHGVKTGFEDARGSYNMRVAERDAGFKGKLQATMDVIKLGRARLAAMGMEGNYKYEMDTASLQMIVNDKTTYMRDPQRWTALSRRMNVAKRQRKEGITEQQIYMANKFG